MKNFIFENKYNGSRQNKNNLETIFDMTLFLL